MNTKEGTTMYQKALRYAARCRMDNSTHRDLVHDAWLKWYDKQGTDLFLESERTVMGVIKRVHWNQFNKNGYTSKGTKHSKRVVSWNYEHGGTKTPIDVADPEEILIGKELDASILANSPELQIEVYKLVLQGYTGIEIAGLLGVSAPVVSWYFRNIRSIASYFN